MAPERVLPTPRALSGCFAIQLHVRTSGYDCPPQQHMEYCPRRGIREVA